MPKCCTYSVQVADFDDFRVFNVFQGQEQDIIAATTRHTIAVGITHECGWTKILVYTRITRGGEAGLGRISERAPERGRRWAHPTTAGMAWVRIGGCY